MKKIIITTFAFLFTLNLILAQTTFNKTQTITLAEPEGDAPYPIASQDLDADGFADIVVGTDFGGSIYWFKNDGVGNFTIQPAITNTLPRVSDIVLADINGDTSIDILATSFTGDKLVYFPNSLAMPGTFGAEIVISSTLDGAGDLDIYDLNGDTFPDIAVSAFNDNKVVWYANNGTGTFGSENLIDNTITSPGSIDMLDIDGDTDLDLVIANATTPGSLTSVIEVFFNSSLTFTKDVNSVTTGKDYLFNVSFEDIDASNNSGITSDILATDLYGNLMHYNRDAMGNYVETILTTTIANPASVGFYDLDLSVDGLKDILMSSGTNDDGSDLVWYKNNGSGNFSAENIIDATQRNTFKFTVSDFDNDGDLDIASAAYFDDQINIFINQKFILGVDEFEEETFRIYPNPVSDKLNLKSSRLNNFKFVIFDALGKELLKGNAFSDTSIEVTNLKSGLYFLKINDSNGVYKFIKE